MPAYSDNYDDSPEPADGGDKHESSGDDSAEQTAVLPKSIFGSEVKPGDYIRLCVEKVEENDVLVHREEDSGKGEKPEEEPMAEAPESPASGSMSSMMED